MFKEQKEDLMAEERSNYTRTRSHRPWKAKHCSFIYSTSQPFYHNFPHNILPSCFYTWCLCHLIILHSSWLDKLQSVLKVLAQVPLKTMPIYSAHSLLQRPKDLSSTVCGLLAQTMQLDNFSSKPGWYLLTVWLWVSYLTGLFHFP